MAEWFKAPVLKTGVPARVPWVRIPPLPPEAIEIVDFFLFSYSCVQPSAQSIWDALWCLAFMSAAAVILAVVATLGAIVSISAKVNKLGSGIE